MEYELYEKDDEGNFVNRPKHDLHFVHLDGTPMLTRTKQEMAAACDINNIMKRFNETGSIDHLSITPPMNGDFTSSGDYRALLHRAMLAEKTFAALPSRLRNRFGQDPGQLMDFMNDPANEEEAFALGLIKRVPDPVDPPPQPVVIIPTE